MSILKSTAAFALAFATGAAVASPASATEVSENARTAAEMLVAADQRQAGQGQAGTAATDDVKQEPATSGAAPSEAKVGESEETHTQGATGMAPGGGAATPGAENQPPAAGNVGAKPGSAEAPTAQPDDSVRLGERQSTEQTTQERSHTSADMVEADDIVGRNVVNRNGDAVGEVSALVVDQKKDVYAVVSVGGFLGIGDREVAIPLTEFDIGDDAVTLMSQQTPDELKSLPEYDEQQFEAVDGAPGTAATGTR